MEDGDSNVVAGADRQTIGRLYRLEWEQLAGSSTQYGFVSLFSTGGKAADTFDDDFPLSFLQQFLIFDSHQINNYNNDYQKT